MVSAQSYCRLAVSLRYKQKLALREANKVLLDGHAECNVAPSKFRHRFRALGMASVAWRNRDIVSMLIGSQDALPTADA